MNNDLKPIQTITPFKRFCMTIGELPSSYLETMTYYEMLVWFTKFLQETVIPTVNNNAEAVKELQDYVSHYFDNLDVQEEINNKLDEMAESGELAEIISAYLELPTGNYIDAQRIGRKIVFGTNPSSSNHNNSGIACGMQGGCVIDENTVAYMLWDNLNKDLNKNKLVIMNINTGEVLREASFTFGWCNSIAYHDGSIYVAVRGTTSSGVSTNNGDIKVINATNLNLTDQFTIGVNVNAISIYDDTLYVLQEGTNTIRLYTLDGTSKNTSINLSTDITNLYNQNIKITDKYIYLLSTQPSNLLNLFDLEGKHIKSYNLPKYGGLYKIGEVQWIDILSGHNMVLGSNITNYEESMNQFFKVNIVENISTNHFLEDYVQTLNVNSETNYYNPDGTTGNEFKTINECDCLDIENIYINGNNKSYKYTYLRNHRNLRIRYSTFTEGLFLQCGNYMIQGCTINYSIYTAMAACVMLRETKVYFNEVTFNANNNAYCINNERYNTYKFTSPTFSNFTTSVFNNELNDSIVQFNDTSNIPYIPRLYGRQFNLMYSGWINQYKPGTYNYATPIGASQIALLFTKAAYIIVGYQAFNNNGVKEIRFNKNSGKSYVVTDTTTGSSDINVRLGKLQMTIDENGVVITSNTTTQILENSTSVISAADSNTADLFLKIRYVKLMIQD